MTYYQMHKNLLKYAEMMSFSKSILRQYKRLKANP